MFSLLTPLFILKRYKLINILLKKVWALRISKLVISSKMDIFTASVFQKNYNISLFLFCLPFQLGKNNREFWNKYYPQELANKVVSLASSAALLFTVYQVPKQQYGQWGKSKKNRYSSIPASLVYPNPCGILTPWLHARWHSAFARERWGQLVRAELRLSLWCFCRIHYTWVRSSERAGFLFWFIFSRD